MKDQVEKRMFWIVVVFMNVRINMDSHVANKNALTLSVDGKRI